MAHSKHARLVSAAIMSGVVALGAAGLGAAGASPPPADPSGNNGTIKVDRMPFDTEPNNEPHVGCTFQVDFYGFDKGDDLFADVKFEAWPPTTTTPRTVLTDTVFIGEDSSDGGGSELGLDAEKAYDLSSVLTGIDPHPEQGWHVKLTIHADGSRGADTKYKVFWVSGCETPGATTTTTVPGEETTTTTVAEEATTTTVGGGPNGGGEVPAPSAPQPVEEVPVLVG